MPNQFRLFNAAQQADTPLRLGKTYMLNGGTGFGDLFMVQPLLEKMDESFDLMVDIVLSKYNAVDLVRTLNPNVRYLVTNEILQVRNVFPDIRHIYEISTFGRFGNKAVSLSRASIERIAPAKVDRDFIVIHPCTRGPERRYHRWSEVDLEGINYKVVGGSADVTGLKNPTIEAPFPEVAALLRASRGVVCVDSSILNLANILGVPTIGVYQNKSGYHHRKCSLPPLINPTPYEVREACISLLKSHRSS